MRRTRASLCVPTGPTAVVALCQKAVQQFIPLPGTPGCAACKLVLLPSGEGHAQTHQSCEDENTHLKWDFISHVLGLHIYTCVHLYSVVCTFITDFTSTPLSAAKHT